MFQAGHEFGLGLLAGHPGDLDQPDPLLLQPFADLLVLLFEVLFLFQQLLDPLLDVAFLASQRIEFTLEVILAFG